MCEWQSKKIVAGTGVTSIQREEHDICQGWNTSATLQPLSNPGQTKLKEAMTETENLIICVCLTLRLSGHPETNEETETKNLIISVCQLAKSGLCERSFPEKRPPLLSSQ